MGHDSCAHCCAIVFDAKLTIPLACNGTIVNDTEMGEVIQLQGDQRKDVKEFLVDKKEGLELDAKTIKVRLCTLCSLATTNQCSGAWLLNRPYDATASLPHLPPMEANTLIDSYSLLAL